jgi:class 3 adenylate cyclase/tetratricopeptide (TPR) repeat protein
MDFRLLGPMEVDDRDLPVPLGGRRQRSLLALLLLRANEVVSSDRLLEDLWGEEAAPHGANALQAAVSRLRKTPLRERLVTRAAGYLVRVEPGELDTQRFEELLTRGRESLDAGNADVASGLLANALLLWRGSTLADFVYEPFAQAEIARLEDLRLVCFEDRIEADLALGRQSELIAELETLVAEHPLRERPRGQLMLALYRAGRQAEALDLYRTTRRMLLDELGLEPGPGLRGLEQAILRHDPSLTQPARPARRARAAAAARPRIAQARKTVTVLFADVADSTGLAEQLDPEALRHVLGRYFEVGSEAVAHHCGSVEKFVGDALMAVFGVPEVHEDDALRAVRAAEELRARVAALDTELARGFGVRLEVRVGLNTGEVVVGDGAEGEALVTGEPVITAARLGQAAGPGEVLLGEPTLRLVASAVEVEPLAPRTLKGKRDSVAAWRLVSLIADAPPFLRRLEAPLVGRDVDLAQLRTSFERAVAERSLQLVTVLGPAGIGKTRLARELAALLALRAKVLQGRCLPYGEGITFWPLRELVLDETGTINRTGLLELVGGEAEADWIVDRLLAAIGLNETVTETDEIFAATRKLLEAVGRTQPVLVVLEDLHWAESTFLDLVEHLVDFSADAPVLILCLGRSELIETRPNWGGGRRNTTSLELAPLTEAAADELLDNLGGVSVVSAVTRSRVKEAAEGNPLFLEQFAAMLTEGATSEAELPLPPTIQALLAARLERLGPGERAVLERVAIVGKESSLDAVLELLPEEGWASAPRHLQELARRQFLRQAQSAVSGEAFRFHHALIQQAVYRGIPKVRRSELHERYAGWLEQRPDRTMAENDEILGYHFEQAYRLRIELAAADDHASGLARRAAQRLADAGHRAGVRGDTAAVANLLSRASALLPSDDKSRLQLQPELGAALRETSDLDAAEAVLDEAIDATAVEGEGTIQARARVARALLRFHTRPGALTEALDEAKWAIHALQGTGDELGLARAWHLLAFVEWWRGSARAAQEAWERSIACARSSGARREERSGLAWLARVAFRGPMPGAAATARCDEILEQVRGDMKAEALALISVSGVRALAGHFDDARALAIRATSIYEELGLESNAAWASHAAGFVEVLAGDPAAAERELRPGYETLVRLGVRGGLPTLGALLAEAIYAQGRFEDAEEVALSIEELQPEAVMARCVRAKAVARLGRVAEGEDLAREALASIEETEFVLDHAEALLSLAVILRLAGRLVEGESAIERAVRLYRQKESELAVDRASALLAELRAPLPSSS